MNEPGPKLLAIGTAVPPNIVLQAEHAEFLRSQPGLSRGEKIKIERVYGRTGIDKRHSVLDEFSGVPESTKILYRESDKLPTSERMKLFCEFAAPLCVDAVHLCFEKIEGFNPLDVTHIVTFSCTGMVAPGIDIELVEILKLNKDVERTCINFMGCYAAITALKTAWHISRSVPEAVILVVGVELCTLHYHPSTSSDQLIANALFADGAAATVVTSSSRFPGILELISFYSEFKAAGKDEMAWKIGDYGFDIRLSAYVPALIEENISELLQSCISASGLTREEIKMFAIHPGGTKILEACEKAIGLTTEELRHSYAVLREFGNMSSVTILFLLERYLREGTPCQDDKVLGCAFGPGLTLEMMTMRVLEGAGR